MKSLLMVCTLVSISVFAHAKSEVANQSDFNLIAKEYPNTRYDLTSGDAHCARSLELQIVTGKNPQVMLEDREEINSDRFIFDGFNKEWQQDTVFAGDIWWINWSRTQTSIDRQTGDFSVTYKRKRCNPIISAYCETLQKTTVVFNITPRILDGGKTINDGILRLSNRKIVKSQHTDLRNETTTQDELINWGLCTYKHQGL